MTARVLTLATACSILALPACAPEVERPTAQMTRANTLIDQAERAGAQKYAAAELQQARDKMSQAEKAANDGKGEVALRLATEASVDAELAGARTASGQAQAAADETRRGVEALEQEATRSFTTPADNGTPR